jgi:signal transduction histidine kinase
LVSTAFACGLSTSTASGEHPGAHELTSLAVYQGVCESADEVLPDRPGLMMTTQPASPAHEFLARQLHVAHRRIADEWLERMAAMLTVGPNDVVPSNQLLDHIPDVIDEIANFLEAPADSGIAANTAVMAKAAELGELRYEQRASVHQLLREYQVFGDVLQRFIEVEVERSNPPVGVSDALSALARLTQAVRCLEQQTINTFVTLYTDKIEQQAVQVREFTRFVSHEIRQPLGVLQVLVRMLPTHLGSPDSPRMLQTLDRNVSRVSEVVNRLERLTRLNSAADDLPTAQDVNLTALVTDVVEQLAEMTAARDVEILIADDLPVLVLEPARAELVFLNLIANAVKYSDPAKSTRRVHIERVSAAKAPTVVVRDNGIGIPRDRLDAIFRQFVRAHAQRDLELGAHGLGLAIVRECMDACQGTVSVESVENVGTTFTLTWPSPTGE